MLHDEEFDVVFLPREILENPPGSWQQMDGYMKTLEEFPDCFIRNELFEILKDIADASKNEKMREVYRYGIDRVSIGYRYKYKEKYKEKIKGKEEVKEIQSKQNEIQKQELQLLTNPPTAPSVIDCVSDGFEEKKEFTKRKKRAPKDESGIWEIRKAFESGYRLRYDTDKTPGWGTKERSVAQMCLNKKGAAETVALLRDHWFAWNNHEVIKGGHSFASGYASFGQKIDELQAAILNPDRLKEIKNSANNEAMAASQVKRESEIQRIADNLKRIQDAKRLPPPEDEIDELVDF